MKLYVVGGGGCLIRNFADYDANRVIINEDICATAKGYEYMALVNGTVMAISKGIAPTNLIGSTIL